MLVQRRYRMDFSLNALAKRPMQFHHRHKTTFSDTHRRFHTDIKFSRETPIVCGRLELEPIS